MAEIFQKRPNLVPEMFELVLVEEDYILSRKKPNWVVESGQKSVLSNYFFWLLKWRIYITLSIVYRYVILVLERFPLAVPYERYWRRYHREVLGPTMYHIYFIY